MKPPATTAHVYYRAGGHIDFVVIDADPGNTGVRDNVKVTETGDDHLGIVCRALADIGYLPADPQNARIVRQADGLGYLPVVFSTDVAGDLPALTAHVTREDNGTLGQVRIGDTSKPLPPGMVWPPEDDIRGGIQTRSVVDGIIIDLGYIRLGGFETTGSGWEAPVEPAEWRDHPTIVRVTDTAAELLTRTAMTLGLPADALASTWITTAAADALRRHQWFSAPGTIVDKRRVAGWLPDGSPDLINTGTFPTGMHGSGGSGM
jgi:hypothetical protein